MKKIMMICTFVCGVSLFSCNSVDDDLSVNRVLSAQEEKLNAALTEFFAENTSEDLFSFYISYSANDDSFVVLTEDDYELYSAFAELVFRDGTYSVDAIKHNAPQGSGWKYYGTCKGKVDSLKAAMQIAKMIKKGADFEIHAEAQADGSYKIWYREI